MKRIWLICSMFVVLFSCKTEENPIPDYRVYLNLNLTYEDKALKAIPSYKKYTTSDINAIQGERVGYGGVLVVHNMLGEYKAFDLACPYEALSSVKVVVDSTMLYAVCPVCGTKYNIGTEDGTPDGVCRHYLKQYTNVILSGSRLIISN